MSPTRRFSKDGGNVEGKDLEPLTPSHEHDTRRKGRMKGLATTLTEIFALARLRARARNNKHASENVNELPEGENSKRSGFAFQFHAHGPLLFAILSFLFVVLDLRSNNSSNFVTVLDDSQAQRFVSAIIEDELRDLHQALNNQKIQVEELDATKTALERKQQENNLFVKETEQLLNQLEIQYKKLEGIRSQSRTQYVSDSEPNLELKKAEQEIENLLTELDIADKRFRERIEKWDSAARDMRKALEMRTDVDSNKLSCENRKAELTEEQALNLISRALEEYSADVIGRSDYALAMVGTVVEKRHGLTSDSYIPPVKTLWDRLLNHFFPFAHSPEIAINPDTNIGNCWACQSPVCNLTLKFVKPIQPVAFSIDHISPKIAHNISSAPRKFRVWGVRGVDDIRLSDSESTQNKIPHELLGEYFYDIDVGKQVQTFERDNQTKSEPFEWIKLEILSNYGHQDYTCLYRFRVHI